jgi:hypothetical protein
MNINLTIRVGCCLSYLNIVKLIITVILLQREDAATSREKKDMSPQKTPDL